ncbi:hypothetical protein [Streptomyces sp. TLI_053]|nr:hypothetical protein [Streptomyces sp. TLI_053]
MPLPTAEQGAALVLAGADDEVAAVDVLAPGGIRGQQVQLRSVRFS